MLRHRGVEVEVEVLDGLGGVEAGALETQRQLHHDCLPLPWSRGETGHGRCRSCVDMIFLVRCARGYSSCWWTTFLGEHMGLVYYSLDCTVRSCMMEELEQDVDEENLYRSSRLSPLGGMRWLELLMIAAAEHDDQWLAGRVEREGLLNSHYPRRNRDGGVTDVKMPWNAPLTLAEGEFNRLYIRGVCRAVIENNGREVLVYRGKAVRNPRPESLALQGQLLDAASLLSQLGGAEGANAPFPGPNSGLTVCRPGDFPSEAV